MFEIIILVFGTRWLAGVAKKRGHSGFLAAMLPAFWIGGEIFGVIVGSLLSDDLLLAILLGLIGAVSGGVLAVAAVHLVPARTESLEPLAGPSPADARDNVWAG
jgi:hypothetical protein